MTTAGESRNPHSVPDTLAAVLVNYNGWRRTASCARWLEADGLPPKRIVVVDNGSRDGSAERLRALLPGAPLHECAENRGFAYGCNLGVETALRDGAEAVLIINPDTVALPGFLARLAAAAGPLTKACVSPEVFFLAHPDRPWFVGAWRGRVPGTFVVRAAGDPRRAVDYLWACCLLVGRSVWQRVGPFDPIYFLNAGLEMARGDRIVLVDGDCVLDPGWLGAIERRHAEGWDVVSGAVVVPPGSYLATAYNYTMFHRSLASRPAGPRGYLSTMNLSLERAAVARVGPVPEDMPRTYDFEWTLRMSEAGLRLFFEPAARVEHHPCGVTPRLLWRARYVGGECSQAVRRRHPAHIRGAALFTHPWLLTLVSPLLATAATARVLTARPADPRLWACLPVIWATKLAWCLGARHGRRRGVMAPEAYTIHVPRVG